jgi:hypothetical protein
MAADGDMYAQRRVWGYNRLCAAAREKVPTENLVEIEKKSIRNMLSNGYAVPSLKQTVDQAYSILQGSNTELGLESVPQRQTRLIETLHWIERNYIEAPSAVDVSKVIRQVALEILAGISTCPSKQSFEGKCCDAVGDFWLHRFGWDSFRANVMKNGGFSREAYDKMAADACQQAIPEVSKLIYSAMQSREGKLPKRSSKHGKAIQHTPEGLNEELK